MKKSNLISRALTILVLTMIISPIKLQAQEEESSSPLDVGFDFVSSYIWRGTKFGTGPAIQPSISFSKGGFTVGGWGNFNFTSDEGAESDLYLAYDFNFGLSVGVTDYYFPGSDYFDYSDSTGTHAFEINLGYAYEGFSISGNYMVNTAGGAGNDGGDLYFEAGYAFKYFGIHLGAGNGWYTMEADADESDFNVCNIGISSSKDVKITENFSLPIFGSVIWNPDTKQFFVVAGVTF